MIKKLASTYDKIRFILFFYWNISTVIYFQSEVYISKSNYFNAFQGQEALLKTSHKCKLNVVWQTDAAAGKLFVFV